MIRSKRLSDAEWKVMDVAWEAGQFTARQVLETLESDTGWAYTTVKTMLVRLTDKGFLNAEMEGNTTLYSPVVDRAEARKSALRSFVTTAFDGAFEPLMHMLLEDRELTDSERAVLEGKLKALADSDDEGEPAS